MMHEPFFEQPILNGPYAAPARHWELDKDGQPTQRIVDSRRKESFFVRHAYFLGANDPYGA